MRKVGILFSKRDYAERFIKTLCFKVDYFKSEIVSEDLNVIELRDYKLYVYSCGIGLNNAVIGSAKLYHNYGCDEIVSVDTCTWVHSQDSVKVGDIIEFNRNVINYDFKKRPEVYHYDECGISDYSLLFDCLLQDRKYKDLLMTTNSELSSSEIMDNLKLKWQKYDNIFYDDSGYGILAYCSANNLKFVILRMVKGLVDNLSVDSVDDIVDYCFENEII